MPPKSPLPPRNGLGASWLRTPDRGKPIPWPTIRDFLIDRLGPLGSDGVDGMLAGGEFVDSRGAPWSGAESVIPNTFIWFHKQLRPEVVEPFELPVIYRDERILVIDKPPFVATTARGRHVLNSVVVRARTEFELPELSPAHRLDRLTSGVLILTTHARWRAAYQECFQRRQVRKCYLAIAPVRHDLPLPRVVRSHLAKAPDSLQVREVPGCTPNAESEIELLETRAGFGLYRLRARTGQMHQLRVHLNALGIPIVGDPLYPTMGTLTDDDHENPLRLLAAQASFVDPVDHVAHTFRSGRKLCWPDQGQAAY